MKKGQSKKKNMIHRGKILLKKSAGMALMILLSGASIAAAALTFTGTAVTSDGALNLTGAAASTFDTGATGNTLSLNTTNNAPITLGTGLLTFTTASGTNLGLANVSSSNVSSTNVDVATRFNFAAASSTGNVTLGGANTQILNQTTLANVSSTNLDVATRFNFAAASSSGNVTLGGANTQILNQTTLANVSSTNVDVATRFTSANVSSTRITAGTSLAIGGGTVITNITCNSTSSKFSSTATTATSTIGIAVSGLTTSTNQSYWVGIASTSAGFADLQVVSIQVSSTISSAVARADIYLRNINSATFAPAGVATTTLCYMNF